MTGFHSASTILFHSLDLLVLPLLFYPQKDPPGFCSHRICSCSSLPPLDSVLGDWDCVRAGHGESTRKVLLLPFEKERISSPLTTLFLAGLVSLGCLPSALACTFGLRFANTTPVQAWGGQVCAPRLSTALVLIMPGDIGSRFLPISTFEFKLECGLISQDTIRTCSVSHAPLSHIRETHGRNSLQDPQPGRYPSSPSSPHPTPKLPYQGTWAMLKFICLVHF